jgi:predicted CopG family antitoxin
MKKTTTIQISKEIRDELKKIKKYNRESYVDVISRLLNRKNRRVK